MSGFAVGCALLLATVLFAVTGAVAKTLLGSYVLGEIPTWGRRLVALALRLMPPELRDVRLSELDAIALELDSDQRVRSFVQLLNICARLVYEDRRAARKGLLPHARQPRGSRQRDLPAIIAAPVELTSEPDPMMELLGELETFPKSERQVAAMASMGFTTVEIAQVLMVTQETVKAHLVEAYRKLDASSRRRFIEAVISTRLDRPHIDLSA